MERLRRATEACGLTGSPAYRLFPAGHWEIEQVLASLRDSDRRELTYNAKKLGRFFPGWTPEQDLREGLAGHQVWTLTVDTAAGIEPLAIGGIKPVPRKDWLGGIWMVATKRARGHWRGMTPLLARMVWIEGRGFSALGNVVPQHMTSRLGWLAQLGFDIAPAGAQVPGRSHVVFMSQRPDTAQKAGKRVR